MAFTALTKSRRELMAQASSKRTVGTLAAAEIINASYVSRVLRLTLLAPEIVEAILLDRRQPAEMTLEVLMKPFTHSPKLRTLD
jgi:hypothetical protein